MSDKNSFPSDSELLHAIKTGDERTQQDAKDKIVKKHREKLGNSIVAHLRRKNCNQSTVHVSGVLSNTWINAFRYLDDLQDPDKFESWLMAIGQNEANRHLRLCINSQIFSVQIDDSFRPPAQISTYYSSKDAAIDADRLLTYAYSISEEFGSIFRLYNEEELSFREIARRLGKHEEAIRTQYYRGLRTVRARFNKRDQ